MSTKGGSLAAGPAPSKAERSVNRDLRMITGAQIQQARILLRLTQKKLAHIARVRREAIERAERSAGELPLTIAHAAAIQAALEAAGVEFTDQDGVQLKPRG